MLQFDHTHFLQYSTLSMLNPIVFDLLFIVLILLCINIIIL
jgi:hypothetical protein